MRRLGKSLGCANGQHVAPSDYSVIIGGTIAIVQKTFREAALFLMSRLHRNVTIEYLDNAENVNAFFFFNLKLRVSYNYLDQRVYKEYIGPN